MMSRHQASYCAASREYRNSSMKCYISLSFMYCFFIAAVALLAASAQVRPGQ
jgi:hypothetical protein